jgi:purine nucleosidase
MSTQQFVHIDTDMGVDDGVALVVATKLQNLTVVALSTVFGNVPVEAASRNAAIFTHLLDPKTPLPFLQGAGAASDGFCCDARHVHGEDGLGGATAMLGDDLLRRIEQRRLLSLQQLQNIGRDHKTITLLGLGPATNIPSLVEWYGRKNIARIVLMSGVFFDRGNIMPSAEFNAYCDPGALQHTLNLGIPTLLIPLDVTRKVQLSAATVDSYRRMGSSPLMQLVAQSHVKYLAFYSDWEGIDGCLPHDSIAVLAANRPDRFFCPRGAVSVDASIEALS